MKKRTFKVKTTYRKLISDTVTPVSIYLKLRDRFAGSLLLESSDYHGNENSFSYLCFDPVGGITAKGNQLEVSYPGQETQHVPLGSYSDFMSHFIDFSRSFESNDLPFKFISNGLFGYLAYDAVQYFEDIKLEKNGDEQGIPAVKYSLFSFVIAVDHFKNELYIFQHEYDQVKPSNSIEEIIDLINNKNFPTYTFSTQGDETSNLTDDDFLKVIQKGKDHCQRGDVFQIVLSRRFQKRFKGDEFNVYRALRSINPSPYLFYFDYGSFKIFGSSPEAQLVVKGREASIFPIAGTFRRTGNDQADTELAEKLSADVKENSEHVMLVDLARNDLSRNGDHVEVETFKEIQFYSHVIHLVSKVTGKLSQDTSSLKVVADTFPAGTLSGAPKYKALELIDNYENTQRGYYGGAIGFLGFNGDFNHAIMIRSMLSKNNTLTYQAGAGVVAKSVKESELQEVHNKLEALRKAMKAAEEINK